MSQSAPYKHFVAVEPPCSLQFFLYMVIKYKNNLKNKNKNLQIKIVFGWHSGTVVRFLGTYFFIVNYLLNVNWTKTQFLTTQTE